MANDPRALSELEYRIRIAIPKFYPHRLNLKEIGLEFIPWDNIFKKIDDISLITEIDLSNNNFKTLDQEIINFKNIKILKFSNNNITSIPSFLNEFNFLEELHGENNKVDSVLCDLSKNNSLKYINLEGNEINEIPESFRNLRLLKSDSGRLNLSRNKFDAPDEIFDQTPEEIINFLTYGGEKDYLNEIKLLLLGESLAGKTSLANALLGKTFNKGSLMTKGITINDFLLDKIKINIWDFGGQEIMHSMHQFFLTDRSIYLFVWNARENDSNNIIEDWLKLIQTYGGNSPIIFIINKIDDGAFIPDKKYFKSKYKNVLEFVETSCKTGEGIKNLRLTIKNILLNLSHLKDRIPKTWLRVKDLVSNLNEDFISLDYYYKLCGQNFIYTDLEKRSLLKLLHDLGVCLNYGDEENYLSTNILNPEWVTKGIYSIINSNIVFNSRGIVNNKSLGQILDERTFPRKTHALFLNILELFELAFPDNENLGDFLIPDLFSKDEPYIVFENEIEFVYKYRFNYLPKSWFPRYIVRSNRLKQFKHVYWQRGIIHYSENNKIIVRYERTEGILTLQAIGNREEGLIEFSKIFVSEIDGLNKTVPGLDYQKFISLPGMNQKFVLLKHLELLLSKGIFSYIPECVEFAIDVTYTLENVIGKVEIEVIESEDDMNQFYYKHQISNLERDYTILNEKKIIFDKLARDKRGFLEKKIYGTILMVVFIPYAFFVVTYWQTFESAIYLFGVFAGVLAYLGATNYLSIRFIERSDAGKPIRVILEQKEYEYRKKIYIDKNFDEIMHKTLENQLSELKFKLRKILKK